MGGEERGETLIKIEKKMSVDDRDAVNSNALRSL